MPEVQYRNVVQDIRKTAKMPTPKRVSAMDAWFKVARKHLKEIPEINTGEWIVEYQEANLDWVRFDLKSRTGQKANVVIMRNRNKGIS